MAIIGVSGTRTLTFSGGSVAISIAGLIRITDAGGPDSGLDRFEFDISEKFPPQPPLPPPTDCSAFPAGLPAYFNDQGDLVVTDAPPLPTSKDQCKNGGWQTYGVFKNQGDCVSFVATGGKNPPAGH